MSLWSSTEWHHTRGSRPSSLPWSKDHTSWGRHVQFRFRLILENLIFEELFVNTGQLFMVLYVGVSANLTTQSPKWFFLWKKKKMLTIMYIPYANIRLVKPLIVRNMYSFQRPFKKCSKMIKLLQSIFVNDKPVIPWADVIQMQVTSSDGRIFNS